MSDQRKQIPGSSYEEEVMVSPTAGAGAVFKLMDSSFTSGITDAKIHAPDLISPSKEGEISMEFSPLDVKKVKCQAQSLNQELGKIDCGSLSNVTKYSVADSRKSNPPSDRVFVSDCHEIAKGELERDNSAAKSQLFSLSDEDDSFSLQPADIFADSPALCQSPDTPVLNIWKSNVETGGSIADISGKENEGGLRRCRSHEIRKNLFDLSNTPPSAYSRSNSSRSLFKRPLNIEVKESNFSKRLRNSSSILYEDLDDKQKGSTKPSVSLLNDITVEADQEERIKSAVDSLQSGELVADGSRNYCLPMISGKHLDLKNIHHETMADLVTKQSYNDFDKLTVIDCRYPYEFQGGHIKGAINIYTEKEMSDFLQHEIEVIHKDKDSEDKIHILVFHCEFSSHRAPTLLRHLRQCDRQINMMNYPKLVFPEIYCLYGGYKEFFAHHCELCDPCSYMTMNDEDHVKAYLHFKARAKTWSADTRR